MTSPHRPDWIAKTTAGGLLGASLAIGASAIFSRIGAAIPMPLRVQLAMWMTVPIWFGVFGSVFFFSTGRRAWLWLGAANVIVFSAVFALRRP